MKAKSNNELPNFMVLYEKFYQELSPGGRAEVRRVVLPEDLIEIPSFYKLVKRLKSGASMTDKRMQRLVYCLPYITHIPDGQDLGKALAYSGINEKRLFMVIRSQPPNDFIQLRRLLQQAEPKVDWQVAAKQLYFWNDLSKRELLENYFLNQTE